MYDAPRCFVSVRCGGGPSSRRRGGHHHQQLQPPHGRPLVAAAACRTWTAAVQLEPTTQQPRAATTRPVDFRYTAAGYNTARAPPPQTQRCPPAPKSLGACWALLLHACGRPPPRPLAPRKRSHARALAAPNNAHLLLHSTNPSLITKKTRAGAATRGVTNTCIRHARCPCGHSSRLRPRPLTTTRAPRASRWLAGCALASRRRVRCVHPQHRCAQPPAQPRPCRPHRAPALAPRLRAAPPLTPRRLSRRAASRTALYSPLGWPTTLPGLGLGVTFQISAAYSRIVRSLENFPVPAVDRMLILVHASWSLYLESASSCAAM